MAFELPDLPYAHDALASKGMSKETLEYHHDIHHNTYVTTLNKLIDGTEWADKSLEEIVKGTYEAGAVAQSGLFNNASQHWNHSQFWEMMGDGDNAMPSELEAALKESFGSVDKFKEDFSAAGAGQFGSGWAWLVKDNETGQVQIRTYANQDPVVGKYTPLLGVDAWEHAYYLQYQNRKAEYFSAIWDVINWKAVQGRL